MRDADTKKSCAEDGQVGPFHACLAITVVRVRTGAKNGCKLLRHNKSDGQLLVKAFHKKKKSNVIRSFDVSSIIIKIENH